MRNTKLLLAGLSLFAFLAPGAAPAQGRKADAPPHSRPPAQSGLFSAVPAPAVFRANYHGIDLRRLAKELAAKPTKGEFETTGAFTRRLHAWKDHPLFGTVRFSDEIAVVFPPPLTTAYEIMKVGYNADTEEASVSLSDRADSTSIRILIPWTEITQDEKGYMGTNGFGASTYVRKFQERDYDISVAAPNRFFRESADGSGFNVFTWRGCLKPSVARRLMPRIRVQWSGGCRTRHSGQLRISPSRP